MCYSIINFPNCLAQRKVNNYIQVGTANINYRREFEDAYILRPSTQVGDTDIDTNPCCPKQEKQHQRTVLTSGLRQ